MTDLKAEVHEAMLALRPLVEERIHEWMEANPDFVQVSGAALTTGFCRGVAAGVQEVLRELFPDCFWRLAGGFGREYQSNPPPDIAEFVELDRFPGGMRDEAGSWIGHFWVEGGDPDGDCLIVDLSADQFGHEEVVVTDRSDVRYKDNCLLSDRDIARPSERAWGMQLFAMWAISRREAACPQAVPA